MENNFIGGFPNAASKEYCERIIRRFEFLNESKFGGRGKIWSRQDPDAYNPTGVGKMSKEDATYYIGGDVRDDLPFEGEDDTILGVDSPLLKEFTTIVWECYEEYVKEYGILSELGRHKMSPYAKIQKTKPSQGYHVWHSDNGNLSSSRRLVVVSLYLNTVKEGGETEFLYQSTRVSPIEGMLLFFPGAWTHPHRGNPPLKGNKYLLTTWLEFVDE